VGDALEQPSENGRLGAGLGALAQEQFCYLTTTGRVSGKPHTIEIWFALEDSTVYMLSGVGDRSDWVRNLKARPEVELRIGTRHLRAIARVVTDDAEGERARDLLVAKYQPGYGGDLASWRARALPVAVDLGG
jgi:deazaflavin-dependent oxidoreductase (nitroreductase family)